MPKPKLAIRPIEKKISIPEDIVAQVDLELWSDLEGKVPFGAWSELATELLRDWLGHRKMMQPTQQGGPHGAATGS
jgi:hypothetical protein